MNDISSPALSDGSRVAVIGGGPAGAFFAYFLLDICQRVGIEVAVDVYERRDFSATGPVGCNMCAGVISESLIQALAIEGINLPSTVVQRGINSFVLHTAAENVTMSAPFDEMRIATVYRGGGPRGATNMQWQSFDEYLLQLAVEKGANVIRERVTAVGWNGDRPEVSVKEDAAESYDLLVGAVGVNSPSTALFEGLGIGYRRPKSRRTSVSELALGADFVSENLGSSMHAFLLNLPGMDFAALIPKGEHVAMCLIGDGIDTKSAETFAGHPAVREALAGSDFEATRVCHCTPQASLGEATHPFGNRVVIIGDSGMSRLNKDGIGSAYRMAKAAAVTAVFNGISEEDFRRYFWPKCRAIRTDNRFGTVIYRAVDIIKRTPFSIRGIVRMIKREQKKQGSRRRMSMILWDMFTGSAPYRDVFLRFLHPFFIARLVADIAIELIPRRRSR
ncbi:MAG: hypothetical protein V3S10_06265 [Dehalococcoidales bacterium]